MDQQALSGGYRREGSRRVVVHGWRGRPLRVIRLDELLEIKKRAGRPKDLAGIPSIEATIAELARQK